VVPFHVCPSDDAVRTVDVLVLRDVVGETIEVRVLRDHCLVATFGFAGATAGPTAQRPGPVARPAVGGSGPRWFWYKRGVSHSVTMTRVDARPTAVVAATTSWAEFPGLWPVLSGEVWACLRAGGIQRGCPNVMLYLDDVRRVEVGVLLDQPCPLTGRVVASTLPAGEVATTVHHGPYDGIGSAHQAVADWCAEQGRRPAGPRWEVYGPHRDDPAELWTEITWLLTR
jgi:effector-binding domain-containing protein